MRVRFFFYLFFISLIVSSCQNSLNFKGWYVRNNSSRDVVFVINGDEYSVNSSDEIFLDYSENATFSISKDYFVSATNPKFFVKNESLYMETEISDVLAYNYCIQNNTGEDLTVTYYDDWYQEQKELNVSLNSSIDFTVYACKTSVKIVNSQNEELNYSETYLNHTFIIYVD